MKYGRGKWKFCQPDLYESPDFWKLFTELVSEIGTSFYNWNILGFQSLDLGLKFSLICHSLSPSTHIPSPIPPFPNLLKFLESRETLVKAKQSKLETLWEPGASSVAKTLISTKFYLKSVCQPCQTEESVLGCRICHLSISIFCS